MDIDTHDNYSWLTSNDAAEPLRLAVSLFEQNINPLRIAKELRKSLAPACSAMVMEQAQLRIRARKKFENADSMFFTGRSLEQSTSQRISRYKATRFAECQSVADVCCGVGGDLISLANRGTDCNTVGVDRDPIACCFAKSNLDAMSFAGRASVECDSLDRFDTTHFDGIHFDPDRRVKGRTVRECLFEPTLDEILNKVDRSRQRVAVKVAPATVVADGRVPYLREWVGTARECKEQVLWLDPSMDERTRLATVVAKNGSTFHYRAAERIVSTQELKFANEIESYIYEPHATVLAAGLGATMANEQDLKLLARGIGYFTSHRSVAGQTPMLKGYRVETVLSVDLKQIHKELQKRNAGLLTIKKRGVDNVIVRKMERLKLTGDQQSTIILTRLGKTRKAIIVTKIGTQQSG